MTPRRQASSISQAYKGHQTSQQFIGVSQSTTSTLSMLLTGSGGHGKATLDPGMKGT